MGFSPPVPQRDTDWEIRAAVLLSLLLQIILIFVGPVRKWSSFPVTRFLVWSCYLLADWVADLALGLLLNNLGNIGGNATAGTSSISHAAGLKHGADSSSSPVIFAFWTPFLLLHLGGPDTITAYSLEDNELWRRHLIGLLFELFSAAVIFFCSLKGNPMVPATVLMFAVGIIKYGERTYSLYSGSVDGFRNSILGDPDPGPNYAKLMTEFDAKEKAGLVVEISIVDGEAEIEAKKAQEELDEGEIVRLVRDTTKSLEARAHEFFLIFNRLFVNLILSYKERKISQAYFLDGKDVTPTKAFEVIEVELNFIYDMVYTKAPVAKTKAGSVLRFVGSGCIVSALLIFFFHHKRDITHVDVVVTYALLVGGLALDAAALAMLLSSNWTVVFLEGTTWLAWLARAVKPLRPQQRRWSERTSQLNLISYCLRKPDASDSQGGHCFVSPRAIRALAKVARTLRVREIFDDFFFIRREPISCRKEPFLLEFAFKKLKNAATSQNEKKCSNPGEAAQKSNSTTYYSYRVEGVHEFHEDITERLKGEDYDILRSSINFEIFDESLLLWHIATDLLHEDHEDMTTVPNKYVGIAKTLSEYMLYLLIKQPEMLSATAGIGLIRYRDTCAEAERFFESAAKWDPDHAGARKMLLSVNTSKKPLEVKGDRSKSVLFDAVRLAKVLRELDRELMWKVVAEVWWQMLTYAAGKCRGSTHVRQLSHGGEFITIVWFLMAHMGLGDMYKIQEGDAKAKLIVHDQ